MPTDQPDWTEAVLVGLAGFTAIGVKNLKGVSKVIPKATTGVTLVVRSDTLISIWCWGITSPPRTKQFNLSVDGTPSAYIADWIGPGSYASNRLAGLKAFGAGAKLVTGSTATHEYWLWLVYSET